MSPRTLRARDATSAIVDQPAAHEIETILIVAPRRERANKRVALFGSNVEHVLTKAPCRVMVVATSVAASTRPQAVG